MSNSLQMLASHFSWVHEVIEKMNKEGKETYWRTLAEGVVPEVHEVGEGIGIR